MWDAAWEIVCYWLIMMSMSPWAFIFNGCCGCCTWDLETIGDLELEVTLAGVSSNGFCFAGNCENANATHIITILSTNTTTCDFQQGLTSVCGSNANHLNAYIQWIQSSQVTRFNVAWGRAGTGFITWGDDVSGRLVCDEIVEQDAPLIADGSSTCDSDGTSATVTVLPP